MKTDILLGFPDISASSGRSSVIYASAKTFKVVYFELSNLKNTIRKTCLETTKAQAYEYKMTILFFVYFVTLYAQQQNQYNFKKNQCCCFGFITKSATTKNRQFIYDLSMGLEDYSSKRIILCTLTLYLIIKFHLELSFVLQSHQYLITICILHKR
jgi:hypothetical protein